MEELKGCDEDILSSVLALRAQEHVDDSTVVGAGDFLDDVIDESLFGVEGIAHRRFFKFERASLSNIHDKSLVDCRNDFMPSREVQIHELKVLTVDLDEKDLSACGVFTSANSYSFGLLDRRECNFVSMGDIYNIVLHMLHPSFELPQKRVASSE